MNFNLNGHFSEESNDPTEQFAIVFDTKNHFRVYCGEFNRSSYKQEMDVFVKIYQDWQDIGEVENVSKIYFADSINDALSIRDFISEVHGISPTCFKIIEKDQLERNLEKHCEDERFAILFNGCEIGIFKGPFNDDYISEVTNYKRMFNSWAKNISKIGQKFMVSLDDLEGISYYETKEEAEMVMGELRDFHKYSDPKFFHIIREKDLVGSMWKSRKKYGIMFEEDPLQYVLISSDYINENSTIVMLDCWDQEIDSIYDVVLLEEDDAYVMLKEIKNWHHGVSGESFVVIEKEEIETVFIKQN